MLSREFPHSCVGLSFRHTASLEPSSQWVVVDQLSYIITSYKPCLHLLAHIWKAGSLWSLLCPSATKCNSVLISFTFHCSFCAQLFIEGHSTKVMENTHLTAFPAIIQCSYHWQNPPAILPHRPSHTSSKNTSDYMHGLPKLICISLGCVETNWDLLYN